MFVRDIPGTLRTRPDVSEMYPERSGQVAVSGGTPVASICPRVFPLLLPGSQDKRVVEGIVAGIKRSGDLRS